MPVCIGTDEAGYGPNLGPLVIAATGWEIPDGTSVDDMWRQLADVVTDSPARGDSRLHVADSKQVYSPSRSIEPLERSVHAFVRQLPKRHADIGSFCEDLSSTSFRSDYADLLGNVVDEVRLPVTASCDQCSAAAQRIARQLKEAGIVLRNIRCRIIFPQEFNKIVEATGSKGKLLSAATLRLVRQLIDDSDETCGSVICDKHGGRNRYDEIISEAFDDDFVFRLHESRTESRYRVGSLDFCFRTKAEELLPVALASLFAKYIREMIMMQFNRFWQHHRPELKPTKGYPTDARRFWEDIADIAPDIGIAKFDIWRCR